MDVKLNLVVIRTPQLEKTKLFYETLGLEFTKEKHNKGLEHYACQIGPTVLEIYPWETADSGTRLGFEIQNTGPVFEKLKALGLFTMIIEGQRGFVILADPDARAVHITRP